MQIQTNNSVQYLMNTSKDMSTDFSDLSNTYFFADSLSSFNKSTGVGTVNWKRYRLAPRQAFNLNGFGRSGLQMLDFPGTAYDNDPNLKIQIRFVSPVARPYHHAHHSDRAKDDDATDIMFAGVPKTDNSWKATDTGKSIVYKVNTVRWKYRNIRGASFSATKTEEILTQSRALVDDDSTQVKLLPFNFIKRGSDNSRSINPIFLLSPGERFMVAVSRSRL